MPSPHYMTPYANLQKEVKSLEAEIEDSEEYERKYRAEKGLFGGSIKGTESVVEAGNKGASKSASAKLIASQRAAAVITYTKEQIEKEFPIPTDIKNRKARKFYYEILMPFPIGTIDAEIIFLAVGCTRYKQLVDRLAFKLPNQPLTVEIKNGRMVVNPWHKAYTSAMLMSDRFLLKIKKLRLAHEKRARSLMGLQPHTRQNRGQHSHEEKEILKSHETAKTQKDPMGRNDLIGGRE